jgi:DNA sulfur modification protein DndD
MIIEKLIVENFRQFLGRQEVVFANLKRKNVTLIHAENGFGKTALLNALLWAFYGSNGLTADFEHPDRILSETLEHEGNRDSAASVTVMFRDDMDKYTLTRTITLHQQKSDTSKTDLSLEVLRDGQTIHVDRPQWRIEALLPTGISPFLFFNGERIDHLAMASNSDEIREAIYQMLGLKLLERAIEDLQHQSVRGKLVREFQDHTDDATVELIRQEQELSAKIKELNVSLTTNSDNQKALLERIADIDRSLSDNQAARDLQKRREEQEQSKEFLETKIAELGKRLVTQIAEDGYVLFSQDLTTRGREITQRLRSEGRMPARVMNSFIQEILTVGSCICGTPLKEHSAEWEKVRSLLTTAGDQNFNNAVSSLDNALGQIEGKIETTRSNLLALGKERAEYQSFLRQVEEELNDIHQKLGDKQDEQVLQLEQAREDCRLNHQEYLKKYGVIEHQIGQATSALESVRNQIAASQQEAELASKAQRRLNAVDEAVQLLQSLLAAEMSQLRQELNDEIDNHFRKIMDREYWAELSEDFILRIKKHIGSSSSEDTTDVAQSTGQRQVTSLVFIASLVALARRRAEIPTILKDVEGGEYPMVMDSPFGQLGEEFRSGVAKWIPNLAPQVILLVSSTQYKGRVDEILTEQDRVGRRYILTYHGPKKREEAASSISIKNKRYRQYFESNTEKTEIKEIEL